MYGLQSVTLCSRIYIGTFNCSNRNVDVDDAFCLSVCRMDLNHSLPHVTSVSRLKFITIRQTIQYKQTGTAMRRWLSVCLPGLTVPDRMESVDLRAKSEAWRNLSPLFVCHGKQIEFIWFLFVNTLWRQRPIWSFFKWLLNLLLLLFSSILRVFAFGKAWWCEAAASQRLWMLHTVQ